MDPLGVLAYGAEQAPPLIGIGGPGWADRCQVIATYAVRLNSLAGTDGSTVSSLICCMHWSVIIINGSVHTHH